MKQALVLYASVPLAFALSKSPALGRVGFSTVQGTVESSGTTLAAGQNLYGPFEAGFMTQQDNVLGRLGCDQGEGYIQGGLDTHLAERIIAEDCDVELPRWEGGNYISLLDSCGGHTNYHFHERLRCLYSDQGTHSIKVAEGLDGVGVYGKWEDFSNRGELPELDACGGHYGITPECPDGCYHYHVQDQAPFTIGCFGPNDDGSLVSVAQCRELYADECRGDDVTEFETPEGIVVYDPWCPCFDAMNSNVGTEELPAIVGGTTATPTSAPTLQPTTKAPTTKAPTATPSPQPTTTITTTTTSTTPATTTTTLPTTAAPTASVTTTPSPTRRRRRTRGGRRLRSMLQRT